MKIYKLIFLILVLSSYVIAEQNKCKFAEEFMRILKMNKRMPYNLAMKCLKEREDKKIFLMLFGGILGIIVAPLTIPLFATVGLTGAAMTASGLATLGGGAIATGGGGMILGSIVLYTTSTTIGAVTLGSTVSAEYCELPNDIYYDIIYDNKEKILYKGEFDGILPYGRGTLKINGIHIETKNGIPIGC